MSLALNSKRYILLLLFLPVVFSGFGQVTTKSHPISRELHLNYDNDLIFFTDQFYSHGVNIWYSRLIKPSSSFYEKFKSKKSDTLKLITRYHYGHSIYTSENIRLETYQEFDRPYAGLHYLKFHVMNFPSFESRNHYQITLGYVGERSGIGNFQQWWHKKFDVVWPRGWDFEIENEPILGLRYERMYKIQPLKRVGITGQSAVDVGNGLNQVAQSLTFHYGKINRLFNSGMGNSRMSFKLPRIGNKDPEEEEGFLFYKINFHAVASNILIEGSLFSNDSPHTEELEHFYWSRSWGFVYTNYYTTFKFAFHKLSNEFVNGKDHRFLSLHFINRF